MRLRRVMAGLALITATAVIGACGSAAAPPPSRGTKPATAGASAPAAKAGKLSPAMASLVAKAEAEGHLNVSWGTSSLGGDAGVHRAVNAMNRYFGTHISVQFTPGPAMEQQVEQIATEAAAGQRSASDVILAAPSEFATVYSKHIFRHIDWPALLPGRITPKMVDSGIALEIGSGISGITYNTSLVPPSQAPKTLADLLNPFFKGKIATTPYAAGFDYLSAPPMWGAAKTLSFARRFSRQVGGLVRCGSEEQVAAGQFAVFALGCAGTTSLLLERKGAPLASVVPSDAAQIRYFEMAVPVNSAHPAAATLLAAFLDTPPGQAVEWQVWPLDLASLPGSHMAKRFAPLRSRGIHFFAPSTAYLAQHPAIAKTTQAVAKILRSKGGA